MPATEAGSVPVPGPALQLWGSALDDGGYVVALSRGVTAAAPRVDLRASYARLVDENDVVVFFSHTLDGSLVHANRAAARALGLPPLQLRGQRLAEFIAPGAEEQLAAYLTTLDGAGSARAILTLRSADGAPRVWLCSGTVESLGAEGGLVRALALDTSELAQAEEALRATEDRYWRSLERGADAIWVFDGRDGACLYVNQRACALLQRDRSQISGRRLGEFMSGDVDAGKGPDGGSHLVRLRRADGSDVPVELRIVDLGDGTWQASGRDVTAWLETQRTLRESEARFRRIVETPSRSIFVAERSGRLRFHNAEFGNLLGATATLAQRQLAELVTEPDRAALGDTLAALAPDRSAAIELQAPHPAKGPRTLRLTLTRTGEEILGEAVDLTEQRALEERVRQAQRLDSVGNLAAGISHDFNNYLTVIQTNLDEAARAAALEAQPPLRTARDAVRAAAELAQQLLAIGRATGEPLRPVPLAPLVADVYRLLQHTLGNAVDLRADVAPDLAVRGSPTQLRQVLINLALPTPPRRCPRAAPSPSARAKRCRRSSRRSSHPAARRTCWSRSQTPARAWTRPPPRACSTPFSPPSRTPAPAWAAPWSTGSCGSTAARSPSTASPDGAPSCASGSPLRPKPARPQGRRRCPSGSRLRPTRGGRDR